MNDEAKRAERREYMRKWRKAHPESCKAARTKWEIGHPEANRAMRARARAKVKADPERAAHAKLMRHLRWEKEKARKQTGVEREPIVLRSRGTIVDYSAIR
jgi:hypothetical protein